MRRLFKVMTILVSVAVVGAETRQMPDAGKISAKDTLVYIGTYTQRAAPPAAEGKPPGAGKGIYVFRLQSAGTEVFQNVTLVPLGLAVETANPTAFELDLKARRLFAVNEIDQFEGKPTGAVSAFAIDAGGTLTAINQKASMGARPCELALAPDGRHVLVANCGGGTVAVLPVADNGSLGDATETLQVTQAGASQGAAPALCATFDPAGRFAFVCDGAGGKLLVYAFDAARGKLTPATPASIALKPDAGPRQLRFRPDGRFAYVLNEKSSTITTFAYDATSAALREVHSVSTVPEYFGGENIAGELHLHRTGKWLYASNVGHNSVVLFTIDAEKGTLTFVEEQGSGGRTPRQFGIEPSSRHLAISNLDSSTVLASRIDDGNGRLKPSGIFAEVPSPTAIRFLPPAEGGR
jgi:6-phosphogluconolactonase